MEILLINVHFSEHKNSSLLNSSNYPSLTLREIEAITPKNHTVDFIDGMRPGKINYNTNHDIIGISAVTPSAMYAYKIADKFRENKKTVVLGGYHASALPKEAKQHADSVVIGEAEGTWPHLLRDFEKGKLKSFYKNNKPVDLKTVPNPERKKFEKCNFISVVKATRGCTVGCEFCSISHKTHGNIFRKKPVEKVIADIKSFKEKFIFFADPTMTIDVAYTKNLFKELAKLNKKIIYCQGNVNVLARDEELLKIASDAGCILWHVGFESINQKTLSSIGKKTNKISDYKKAIQKINDYGMILIGEFVFGFDNDTKNIFRQTKETIKDWNIMPGFQVLIPYPGSALFNRLESEGRILTRDWSKYTIWNAVFEPKNMNPSELENGVADLYRDFYSISLTSKRIISHLKYGFYPFMQAAIKNMGFFSLGSTINMERFNKT